ncbi:MAG: hypothetical protein HQK83_11770 [Fibrobacteria bacterium]|nr:hypothetical protein [Fibrobacteria bacterium]
MCLKCIICGHEEKTELVTHINEEHSQGGLLSYLMFFPFARVVNRPLFTAIKTAVNDGLIDNSVPGMKNISSSDRVAITRMAESQKPIRSAITVMED